MTRAGLCIGCGACVSQSGGRARMAMDRYGELKPTGPRSWRNDPNGLARTCPFSPHASNEDVIAAERFPEAAMSDVRLGRFEAAYVGHVAEAGFRAQGSSGGMVTWTATELLRRGLVDGVAHVAAQDPRSGRHFAYVISRTAEELRAGSKSRYYPVELSSVLEAIRSRPGRYAVVGVPCFIKAVHLLRAEDPLLAERIVFTLGLYCGHSKSARMVESFAWQMGRSIGEVEAVDFRLKDPTRPANWYTAQLRLVGGEEARRDWWGMVDGDWGAGFFQNAACNHCDDVVAETADVAFGDAWLEPYSSDGRGTNVVLVRSKLLRRLVEEARSEGRLDLEDVDADFVAATQAAGLRQRREGLSLRLSRARPRLRLSKRVEPRAGFLNARRYTVYRLRAHVAYWSHRVFWLARTLRAPGVYLAWARLELTIYQAVTYSRGRMGRWLERLHPDV